MPVYATPIDARVPLLIESLLKQSGDLTAYFDKIGALESKEMLNETPPAPFLAVVPGWWDDARRIGGRLEGFFPVSVLAIMQPTIATDPSLAPPDAVTVASGAAGPLTGTYYYALAGFTTSGLSVVKTEVLGAGYATPATATITVTDKKINITPPALGSFDGFMLFRTQANRQRLLFHSILRDSSVLVDTKADADLGPEEAPVRFGDRCLMGLLKETLYQDETLKIAGSDVARAVTQIGDIPEEQRPDRNVRILGVRGTYKIVYDREERLT